MEQINLNPGNSDNPFDEKLTVDKINQQFRQENSLKGVVHEFTIFNDIYLNQMIKKKHRNKSEFHIDMDLLDASPKHEFILAYDWLITTIFSSLTTILILYIFWFSNIQVHLTTAYIITAFSVSFSSIMLLVTLLKTDSRVELFSRYGAIPVVKFINNNPSKGVLTEFLNNLHLYVTHAQRISTRNTQELLSMELKELRRLQTESIISLDLYEQAKKNIFSHKAFKSISG